MAWPHDCVLPWSPVRDRFLLTLAYYFSVIYYLQSIRIEVVVVVMPTPANCCQALRQQPRRLRRRAAEEKRRKRITKELRRLLTRKEKKKTKRNKLENDESGTQQHQPQTSRSVGRSVVFLSFTTFSTQQPPHGSHDDGQRRREISQIVSSCKQVSLRE